MHAEAAGITEIIYRVRPAIHALRNLVRVGSISTQGQRAVPEPILSYSDREDESTSTICAPRGFRVSSTDQSSSNSYRRQARLLRSNGLERTGGVILAQTQMNAGRRASVFQKD